MSYFQGDINLKMLTEFEWELITPFMFVFGNCEKGKPPTGTLNIIKVPAGFKTDLASVPRLFWTILPPYGEYAAASIIHDYLYTTGMHTKSFADNIFLEGMTVMGVARWRRIVMYYAVKYFGKGNYK